MSLFELDEETRRSFEENPLFYYDWNVHTWLSPAEVEKQYGVKRDTLRKWFYRGHLPGKRWTILKFRRVDVERVIRKRMPHLLKASQSET
jgi:hypothetical protein